MLFASNGDNKVGAIAINVFAISQHVRPYVPRI